MGDQKIRVGQAVYEELKRLAERTGRSIRELAEEAIQAYIFGREGEDAKQIKGLQGKIIVLQYPARCKMCGKQLKPGELAYYVKVTYTDNTVRSHVVCLDCYYKSTALKEYYIKKKQLEAIIRGLKKEADKLAEEVVKLRTQKSIYELKRDIGLLVKDIYELIDIVTDPKEEDALHRIVAKLGELDELLDKLKELEDNMTYIESRARDTLKRVERLRANMNKGWDKW